MTDNELADRDFKLLQTLIWVFGMGGGIYYTVYSYQHNELFIKNAILGILAGVFLAIMLNSLYWCGFMVMPRKWRESYLGYPAGAIAGATIVSALWGSLHFLAVGVPDMISEHFRLSETNSLSTHILVPVLEFGILVVLTRRQVSRSRRAEN